MTGVSRWPSSKTLPSFEGAFSLAIMDQGRLDRSSRSQRVQAAMPRPPRRQRLGHLLGVGRPSTSSAPASSGRLPRERWSSSMPPDLRSFFPFKATDPKLCIFEFVYFARPDSQLYGQNIHAARHEMGRRLAMEHPVDADVVVPVPESGIPAAQGFALESGIPYTDGLVKNRYVGRTFIEPSQMHA